MNDSDIVKTAVIMSHKSAGRWQSMTEIVVAAFLMKKATESNRSLIGDSLVLCLAVCQPLQTARQMCTCISYLGIRHKFFNY